MRSGPELPAAQATRSRRAALGTAIGTLVGVELLVFCIYVTTNLLVGLFSLAQIMLTGVLMVFGDTVCDMPVLLMVVLTERMSPWRRWALIGAAVLVDTTTQSAWDTWAREQSQGLIVHAVNDIVAINPDDIQPLPDVGKAGGPSFLEGLATLDDRMITVVSLERLVDATAVAMPLAA